MDDALGGELKVRFRETALVRLAEMRALLSALREDPADRAALERLAIHFHALAGMGGTYGFPEISRLGDEAEETLRPVIRSGQQPEPLQIARWQQLAEEIAGDLC